MTTATLGALHRLHDGLGRRSPVEQVSADILQLAPAVSPDITHELQALAGRSSWERPFDTHPGLERAVNSAVHLAGPIMAARGMAAPAPDAQDPGAIASWLETAVQAVGLDPDVSPVRRSSGRDSEWGRRRPTGARGDRRGHSNPESAFTATQVRQLLPGISVRAYRNAVKAITHLQARNEVLGRVRPVELCTRFGKSRLAADITWEAFSADPATAAFVAYYTARLGQQTLFTVQSQARPMDDIAEALLEAAQASSSYRPDVVAHVLTRRKVLAELTPQHLGDILGRYSQVMHVSGRVLESNFRTGRDSGAMVTQQGDDSTAWNMASRAFNQARTGWLNLMDAAGLQDVVDQCLPGKVPALVAGDVSAWHADEGSSGHADLAVWAALPRPWLVLDGRATCTREQVEQACAAVGMDPASSGWTQAYAQSGLETPRATLALVAGVQVHSPELARLLSKGDVLSGYRVNVGAMQRAARAYVSQSLN